MQKVISEEDLLSRIGELLKGVEVIGPKELPNKGIFYQPLINAGDLYLGEGVTIEPIKKFFLSPSECIFKEGFKDSANLLEDTALTENRRIIIGARPCETRGLVLLDKVFDSEYKDSFYINNRKRTITIGLACSKPDKSCFCTSMGSSPVDTQGMDALLFKIKGNFVIDLITDKAKEIFGSLGAELDDGQKKTWKLDKEKRKNLVKKKIEASRSLEDVFESDYWDEVSKPCISCGICTYLCPTCHCFDLVDVKRKRLRCYDGCSFSDFTLQTSGENPRPTKKERYRQRVFHKFDYFKKNFGENLCVGCGRCIRFCPVKMDIADIVDKAQV